MNSIARLAILLFCTAGAAQAAEPMRELGMPLGKKMQLPIALCPSQEQARDAALPCWVEQPMTLEGGIQWGSLLVPASMPTHKWATPGTYGAAIDRNGILRAVTVHSARADEYAKIKGVLSQSFGKPRTRHTDDRLGTAQWVWKDAVIELNCNADAGCNTRFVFDDRNEWTQQVMANVRSR